MKKTVAISRWLPAALIVLAAVLVYWNSFGGVFVYDDTTAIRDNVHIRKLWPLSEAMSLSHWTTGSTLDGRPLLSLSFALNYALLGGEPWGYHLGNLLIHIAAALLLFGIVRRTLGGDSTRSTMLAFAVALLWAVHPIQTESVTYISQRAESLMGMCYLLTLYCAIRALTGSEALKVEGSRFKVGDQMGGEVRGKEPVVSGQWEEGSREQGTGNQEPRTKNQEPRTARLWQTVAVASCALGMAVKEVMITAPVAVLLYDYTFVSGSFQKALRRRPWFYAGLFGSWLVTLGLLCGIRSDLAENYEVMPWSQYLFAQPGVILEYLRLVVWPHPLIMDYNWPPASISIVVVLQTIVVGGLVCVSLLGLWRRHWAGFLGTFVVLVLGPTSSILPNYQLIHLHRMYLPLAAVVTFAVVSIGAFLERQGDRGVRMSRLAFACMLVVAVVFGLMTYRRNRDYHSEIEFWQDNVDQRPESSVAHCSLGQALQSRGRFAEAIEHYRKAREIDPEYTGTYYSWGVTLSAMGRPGEAIEKYEQALRLSPNYAKTHNNMGNALQELGRYDDAIGHYEEALRLKPDMADAQYNLGNALQALGRFREAIPHYQQALRIRPGYVNAYNNLGNALLALGRAQEAITHYQKALLLQPDNAAIHYNLGLALQAGGKLAQAIAQIERAVQLSPESEVFREKLREMKGEE